MKFRSDVAGQVTALRFYKGSGNTGTHVGHLWSATGTLLATVTFTGESATGWQQANLSTPVTLTAGTTYVASYYAPNGHYAEDDNFFLAAATDAPPLHALKDGTDGPNGVYRPGTGGGFPTQVFQSANYWVDVVFAPSNTAPDTTPPTVTAQTPAAGATGVATGTTVTATFSEPVQPATVAMSLTDRNGGAVPGGVATTALRGDLHADGRTGREHHLPSRSAARPTQWERDDADHWSFTTAAADTTHRR